MSGYINVHKLYREEKVGWSSWQSSHIGYTPEIAPLFIATSLLFFISTCCTGTLHNHHNIYYLNIILRSQRQSIRLPLFYFVCSNKIS